MSAGDFAPIGDVLYLTVTGRSRMIDVALDGEVRRIPLPLAFSIEPLALTVVVPDSAAAPGHRRQS